VNYYRPERACELLRTEPTVFWKSGHWNSPFNGSQRELNPCYARTGLCIK